VEGELSESESERRGARRVESERGEGGKRRTRESASERGRARKGARRVCDRWAGNDGTSFGGDASGGMEWRIGMAGRERPERGDRRGSQRGGGGQIEQGVEASEDAERAWAEARGARERNSQKSRCIEGSTMSWHSRYEHNSGSPKESPKEGGKMRPGMAGEDDQGEEWGGQGV
jgi:hypothetical protein